ncbi:MAG: DUF1177 domain-containing protein [Halobacteriales archaeon]|nr:DUF1177 domain-containing protein [Halobacteriales archaeon]
MYGHVTDILELLDDPTVDGAAVRDALETAACSVEVTTIEPDEGDDGGSTDFLSIEIPGTEADTPTFGIVGRLGGIGARPDEIGMVSDADGAVVALSAARKLATMAERGDRLPGTVLIGTHVCPDAPTIDHDPVPFMTSPVETATMNANEVDERMDALVSIDTTKGNRIHNERGFAITPTIKEGWLLKPADDLLGIYERVAGEPASTLAVTMQDMTPYGSGVHHINSILQPATATTAPVVGVATTAATPVSGSATGANYVPDIAAASRFVVETAKDFTRERARFYDPEEYDRLVELFGEMDHLQTLPSGVEER